MEIVKQPCEGLCLGQTFFLNVRLGRVLALFAPAKFGLTQQCMCPHSASVVME